MVEDSPYEFDNLESVDQLHSKPMAIVLKKITSEQWSYFYYAEPDTDGFDGFDVVWNEIAPLIGICLINFSELENELEHSLYEMISLRSDQLGMVITREMTFEQKMQAYVDALRLTNLENDSQHQSDISQLKTHLKRAGELRNVIAHAKWPSYTEEGYVFSRIDTVSSSTSELGLKYYQLDKERLENYRAYLGGVANMVNYIHSEYFEK